MWACFYFENHFSLSLSSLEITGFCLWKLFLNYPIMWLSLSTWQNPESPGERVSKRNCLDWAVEDRHVLSSLTWEDPVHCRQHHPLSRWHWTVAEWGNWSKHNPVGMHAFLPLSTVAVVGPELHAPITVTSPQGWTESTLYAKVNPFPTQLLPVRVLYHSKWNRSGTNRKSHSNFLRFLSFLLLLERPAY